MHLYTSHIGRHLFSTPQTFLFFLLLYLCVQWDSVGCRQCTGGRDLRSAETRGLTHSRPLRERREGEGERGEGERGEKEVRERGKREREREREREGEREGNQTHTPHTTHYTLYTHIHN